MLTIRPSVNDFLLMSGTVASWAGIPTGKRNWSFSFFGRFKSFCRAEEQIVGVVVRVARPALCTADTKRPEILLYNILSQFLWSTCNLQPLSKMSLGNSASFASRRRWRRKSGWKAGRRKGHPWCKTCLRAFSQLPCFPSHVLCPPGPPTSFLCPP